MVTTADRLPVVSRARAVTVWVPSSWTTATPAVPGVVDHGAPSIAVSTDATPEESVALAVTRTGAVVHQPSAPSGSPAPSTTTGSAASVTVTVATGSSAEPRTTVPRTSKVPGAA